MNLPWIEFGHLFFGGSVKTSVFLYLLEGGITALKTLFVEEENGVRTFLDKTKQVN
jgi:hypothetical protein